MSLSARVLSMLVRANAEQFSEGMKQVRKEVTDTNEEIKKGEQEKKKGKEAEKEGAEETGKWGKKIEEIKGKWNAVKEIVGQVTEVVAAVGKGLSKLSENDKELNFANRFEGFIHALPVIGQAFKAGQDLNEGLRDSAAAWARAAGASDKYALSLSSVAARSKAAVQAAEELQKSTNRLEDAQGKRIRDEQAVEDLRAEDDFARKRLRIERDYQERKREIEASYKRGDVRTQRDLGVAGERRQLELDEIDAQEKEAAERKAKEAEEAARRADDERLRVREEDARRRQEEEDAERKRWDEDAKRADDKARKEEEAAKKVAEIKKKADEEQEKLLALKRKEDAEWEKMKEEYRKKEEEKLEKYLGLIRGGAGLATRGSDEEWRFRNAQRGPDLAQAQLDQLMGIAGHTEEMAQGFRDMPAAVAGELN